MPTVLLLEDNETDAYIARKALLRGAPGLELVLTADLGAARAYLEAAAQGEKPIPDVVFADLCHPEGCRLNLVEWARQRPQLRLVRFVVVTDHGDRESIRRAYESGVSSFLAKSEFFAEDGKLASLVAHYWLNTNRTIAG